ncbi:hypothetical protein GIB67_042970 [Kingdonia uniflora]|uniref:Uncharacterized protein n=1 Tax=Kingdonia uniflora TaxID=39325 RepID=A0A7J7L5Z2_9MAGN|nr:hypothetical protein GIB67_042970 [Kingdonia uniflora]
MSIESLVRKVLKNLKSVSIQEDEDFKHEVEKIQSNLSVIHVALEDAEKPQMNDDEVQHWLGRVKAFASDVNVLLKEFKDDSVGSNSDTKVLMKKKVPFLSPSNPFKTRSKRDLKIKSIKAKLDQLLKELDMLEIFIGREKEKSEILGKLLESVGPEIVSVITIVAPEGLGKTRLAKLIYNENVVESHFDLRIWVSLSKVFNLKNILEEIIKSATKSSNLSLTMGAGEQSLQMDAGVPSLQMNAGVQALQIDAGEQTLQMNAGVQNLHIDVGVQNLQMGAGHKVFRWT